MGVTNTFWEVSQDWNYIKIFPDYSGMKLETKDRKKTKIHTSVEINQTQQTHIQPVGQRRNQTEKYNISQEK